MAFGENLRSARFEAGLSQQALADRLAVTQPTISNWETGAVEPRPDQRAALEEILGPLADREDEESTDDSVSPVGAWLLKARSDRGLTRAQLAERSGISYATIFFLETGKTQNPHERTRRRLSEALGEEPPADTVEATEEAAEIDGMGLLTDFDPNSDEELPEVAGVYVFYDISQRPIYVGESGNIAARIRQHRDKFWFRPPIVEVGAFVEIPEKELRTKVERVLIRFLKSNAVINKQHVER